MKVKVANRMYKMPYKQYKGLLQIAKEQVPFGIYGIEKEDYAELRCDHCKSKSSLKAMIRQFKELGYKVHANGR